MPIQNNNLQDHFLFAKSDEEHHIRSSEIYPRKPMAPFFAENETNHASHREELQVFLDDSSEEAIPIPEELSVSQIPI